MAIVKCFSKNFLKKVYIFGGFCYSVKKGEQKMDRIERIKKRKKELGLTFEQLSSMSSVPIRTLENMCHGITRHPRIDTIALVERALGLDTIPQETDEEEQWRTLFNELTEEELEELTTFVDYLLAKRDKKKPHHNGRANN